MDNCDVLLEEANPLFHIRKWMFIEGFKVLRLFSVNVGRFLLKTNKKQCRSCFRFKLPYKCTRCITYSLHLLRVDVPAVLCTSYVCRCQFTQKNRIPSGHGWLPSLQSELRLALCWVCQAYRYPIHTTLHDTCFSKKYRYLKLVSFWFPRL